MDPQTTPPTSRRRSKRRAKGSKKEVEGAKAPTLTEDCRDAAAAKSISPSASAGGTSPLGPRDSERLTAALLRVLRSLLVLSLFLAT